MSYLFLLIPVHIKLKLPLIKIHTLQAPVSVQMWTFVKKKKKKSAFKCGLRQVGEREREREGVEGRREKPTEDNEVERKECETRREKMSAESIKA